MAGTEEADGGVLGLRKTQEQLAAAVENALRLRIGASVLLQGPRGSGKSALVQQLFGKYRGQLPFLVFDSRVHSAQDVVQACLGPAGASCSQFVQYQRLQSEFLQKPCVVALENYQGFQDDLLYKLADSVHDAAPVVLLLTSSALYSENSLSVRVRSRLAPQRLQMQLADDGSVSAAVEGVDFSSENVQTRAALCLVARLLPGEIGKDAAGVAEAARHRLRLRPSLGQFVEMCGQFKLLQTLQDAQGTLAEYLAKPPAHSPLRSLSFEAQLCLGCLYRANGAAENEAQLTRRINALDGFSSTAKQLAASSLFELQELGVVSADKRLQLLLPREQVCAELAGIADTRVRDLFK